MAEHFGKKSKPFFGKILKDKRKTLVHGDKVITKKKDLVKKMIDHFRKILKPIKLNALCYLTSVMIPLMPRHASALQIKEISFYSFSLGFLSHDIHLSWDGRIRGRLIFAHLYHSHLLHERLDFSQGITA